MRVPRRIAAVRRMPLTVGSCANAGDWLSAWMSRHPRARLSGTMSGDSSPSGAVARTPCTAVTSVTCTNRCHGCAAPGRGLRSKPSAGSVLNSS
jgi:hypothetical protein